MDVLDVVNIVLLRVEPNLGSTIYDVARVMCAIANTLNVCVETNFNDVELFSYPSCNPDEIVFLYHSELLNKKF